MNTTQYLSRINYRNEVIPTLENLKQLQKLHVLNVPFENLDIHLHNTIDLNTEKLFQKIVQKRRGGFCYELNGLFNALLRSLGYSSSMISARVFNSQNNTFGEEFDHLALIVTLDNTEYLVDVGFGEFAFYPLRIEMNIEQSDPRGTFIIEKHHDEYFIVYKLANGIKKPEYIFTRVIRDISEFQGMCTYHQTNANSHFVQKRLISRPTEKGRITISDTNLTITNEGKKNETKFEDDQFPAYVLKWFNITL